MRFGGGPAAFGAAGLARLRDMALVFGGCTTSSSPPSNSSSASAASSSGARFLFGFARLGGGAAGAASFFVNRNASVLMNARDCVAVACGASSPSLPSMTSPSLLIPLLSVYSDMATGCYYKRVDAENGWVAAPAGRWAIFMLEARAGGRTFRVSPANTAGRLAASLTASHVVHEVAPSPGAVQTRLLRLAEMRENGQPGVRMTPYALKLDVDAKIPVDGDVGAVSVDITGFLDHLKRMFEGVDVEYTVVDHSRDMDDIYKLSWHVCYRGVCLESYSDGGVIVAHALQQRPCEYIDCKPFAARCLRVPNSRKRVEDPPAVVHEGDSRTPLQLRDVERYLLTLPPTCEWPLVNVPKQSGGGGGAGRFRRVDAGDSTAAQMLSIITSSERCRVLGWHDVTVRQVGPGGVYVVGRAGGKGHTCLAGNKHRGQNNNTCKYMGVVFVVTRHTHHQPLSFTGFVRLREGMLQSRCRGDRCSARRWWDLDDN